MPRRATKTSYGGEQGNTPKGNDPKRPGPGPKGKTFNLFLKRLRESAAAQSALQAAAEDATSRNFASAWKTLTEYDADKPAEKREHSGSMAVKVIFGKE